jgi:acetyltransferase-like isoleucine patch superfamily enzyme
MSLRSRISANELSIGDRSSIGKRAIIRGLKVSIGKDVTIGDNIELRGSQITIGDRTEIRSGSHIIAYEEFRIGSLGVIGARANLHARQIVIGDEFYSDDNPIPLTIGGGGSLGPQARIRIGNRCVMHNNLINVAEPVTIGNDVGFSPDASIYTHGFWNSVLEGYPAVFAPVTIGDKVWLGFRCSILPGVKVGDGSVIAAGAVVTRDVPSKCIVGGVPARVVEGPPDFPRKILAKDADEIMKSLVVEYADLLHDKGFKTSISEYSGGLTLRLEKRGGTSNIVYFQSVVRGAFPSEDRTIVLSFEDWAGLSKNHSFLNLSTLQWRGLSDQLLSDLRDFLRRRGIKFSGERFGSIAPEISEKLFQED